MLKENLLYPIYEWLLKREIEEKPRHVAFIQDGNRRYARQRGEEAAKGHEYGAETTEALIDWAEELDIKETTLYVLSTENLDRPQEELDHLVELITQKLRDLRDDDRVHENNIRIRGIGDKSLLPKELRKALTELEEETQGYNDYHINLAIGYGGRNELLYATRSILSDIETGEIDVDDIDDDLLGRHIYSENTGNVDLVIRTGGDIRLSNFLPWQAKGNESTVYFCAPYWPAFNKIEFLRAIRIYGYRERKRRERDVERALTIVKELGLSELESVRSLLRLAKGDEAEAITIEEEPAD